jgi:hypothetical protein
VATDQSGLAHQPRHPFAPTARPHRRQLGVEAWGPVGAPPLLMDPPETRRQPFIGALPGREGPRLRQAQ